MRGGCGGKKVNLSPRKCASKILKFCNGITHQRLGHDVITVSDLQFFNIYRQ